MFEIMTISIYFNVHFRQIFNPSLTIKKISLFIQQYNNVVLFSFCDVISIPFFIDHFEFDIALDKH